MTKCGTDVFILWQVDIDAGEGRVPAKQMIKVWAVGNHTELDKAVNSVILLQRAYTKEHTESCRSRPRGGKKLLLPNVFDDAGSIVESAHDSAAKLNVTDVDPEAVDMASGFETQLMMC